MADNYNEEESMQGTSLEAEYDSVFEGDEKANAFLKLTSDAFTREFKRIDIRTIGFTDPVKKGRQKTMSGLTSTVKDLGVLVPIHVMTVDEDMEDDDYKYVLLSGLRRVYAALKNGQKEIDAIVWDFKDKDKGMDLALFVSLLLDRKQRRSWTEIWHLYQVLELQSAITPGTLEYLLDLESGDAMKLKDVMLSDYDEPKDALLNDEKSLDACYKMLAKLRKEEDRLAMEDAMGVQNMVEDAEDLASDNVETESGGQLSDEDVLELLEMTEDLDNLDDVNTEDFASLNDADSDFVDKQKVGERHPIDPALRQAVLARDNFTCACCNMRMVGARLGLIAVHHKIPVHCGGEDKLENLIVLCVNDHVSLHIMERNGGSILMSEDDWFESSARDEDNNIICIDSEGNETTDYQTFKEAKDAGASPKLSSAQTSLLKARKLAKIAIEADKRRGLSKKAVQEATQDALRHPMPGAGLKDNQEAYARTKH